MSPKTRALGATVTIAALLALAPQPALAWGDNGHRIVARIGDDALSPAAAAAVAELTGGLTLAMLATWPDFIRAEDEWRFASKWHYVTVEDDSTLDEVLARSALTLEPDNVVEAIEFFAAVLAGDGDRRKTFRKMVDDNRARLLGDSLELSALAFLVHFVGDIHQPLHVGRGNDLGGNSISVNWFGEVKKLHAVWDTELIEHLGLSFTEFVAFLEAELGGELEAGGGGPPAWARESRAYRHKLYEIWGRTSRDNYLPDLGYQYAHDHIGTVKRRLYLGGLRLAGLLDSVFD